MNKGLSGGVEVMFGQTVVQMSRGMWKVKINGETVMGTFKQIRARLKAERRAKRI